ncbi:MAG: hypothetical protein IK102_08315 [Treponema sp.]|nr:hypothetical protein [Treponema sp.]
MKQQKIFFTTVASILLLGIIFVLGINLYIINYAKPYIYTDITHLPQSYTVIIPGAKVYANNISYVVRDRIEAGVDCINHSKAQRILISGDHGRTDYDEVNQMRLYTQKIYNVQPDTGRRNLRANIIYTPHPSLTACAVVN